LGKAQHLVDVYECEASLFGKASKLRKVMKRLAIATDRTLYVGDETRDIDAALRAHVSVAAATWGYGHRNALEARRPTHMLDSFSDLLRVTNHQRPRLREVSG
jgi:phosphoglycolate phosphatase